MPTYDYQCRRCDAVTEVIHSMLEDGPSSCDLCGGELRRILYPAGIIFKGSGFYRTDSRASSGDAQGDRADAASTASEAPSAPGEASSAPGAATDATSGSTPDKPAAG
ncbi:MAG: FmdB family zinc ribbon protein [Candidatus Limnocylindria bacterium]